LDGTPYIYQEYSKKPTSKINIIQSIIPFFQDLKELLLFPTGPFDSICNLTQNANKPALTYDGKRTVATIPDFEFSDILHIKKSLGDQYTVNDILVACWGGTLRRYLEKTNDPILQNPERILIRGQAPFALPRPSLKGKVFCNMIFAAFKFPVGEKTPLERVRAANKEFNSIKNSKKIYITKYIGEMLLSLGLDSVLIDTTTRLWHRVSIIFSNVAGPRDRIVMYGKPLVAFRPFYSNVIHQVIFFSYAGKVSLSMVLDHENIKHPEWIGKCFLEELEAMKNEMIK